MDRRGSGPLWFVTLAIVVIFVACTPVAIARATADDCDGVRQPRVAGLPARVGVPRRPRASGDRARSTGSNRSPTTSAPPTCATRSPRAPSRRWRSSSTRSASSRACGCSTWGAVRAGTPTRWPGRASRCVGVDISQRFVDLATADAPPGATFVRGDARALCLRRRVRRRHLAVPGRLRAHRWPRRAARRRRCRAGRHGPGAATGRSSSPCPPSPPTSRCASSRTRTPSTPSRA